MRKLLTEFVDMIFPPRPNELLVRKLGTKNPEQFYRRSVFEKIIFLTDYQSPLIQSAIIENKFHHNAEAAKILSTLLFKWQEDEGGNVLFIPIPLGKKRLKDRGYNQVESILNKQKSLSYNSKILQRVKETKPQSKISRSERFENIKTAFAFCPNRANLSDYDLVVILDDVVTTGATLKEAERTLKPHLPAGTKLITLAISH